MTSREEKQWTYLRKDVEDRPARDRKYRFRDGAILDPDDQRRVNFKTELLESVEGSEHLEDFRKSDGEVSFLLVANKWTILNLLSS